MSDVSTSISVASGSRGLSVSSVTSGGTAPASGAGTGVSIAAGQQMYAARSSSTSIFDSGVAGLPQVDQRFAQTALALLSILLGLQDKDDDKKKTAALFAGLMLGGMLRGGAANANLSRSQVSQVSYAAETYSLTAVQGASYVQSGGSLDTSAGSLGQSINVSV